MSKKPIKKYCVVWEDETIAEKFLSKSEAIKEAQALMSDDDRTFSGAIVYVCEVIGSVEKPKRVLPEFKEVKADD